MSTLDQEPDARDRAGDPRREAPRRVKKRDDPGAHPAGLDPSRHSCAQRAAQEAEVLRKVVVPAQLATAIRIDQVGPSGYRAYLDQLIKDAGHPTDPIEVLMLEQLVMAHFRIAQLHGSAGQAQGIEAVKMLSAAAARLLGEFRRTALAIRAYRAGVPGDSAERAPRLHKLAQ
jgi:hypothetical protein